jgi:bacillithiol biosynthesis deacetylase BshB1
MKGWEMPVDVLFLSPHPDDVEIFCGGSIAKLAALDRRVGIADLSAGELASNGDPETRQAEAREAARILGVPGPRICLGLPDGGIDDRDPEQLRSVVELLRGSRCRLLVAPWRRDRHPDHEATARLARRAWFFAGLSRFEASGPPHRPRALWFYPAHRVVKPQVLIDVSEHVERWRRAVLAHESQVAPSDGRTRTYLNRPDFLAEHEARRRYFGTLAATRFAEGFRVEHAVVLDDPLSAVPAGDEPR